MSSPGGEIPPGDSTEAAQSSEATGLAMSGLLPKLT